MADEATDEWVRSLLGLRIGAGAKLPRSVLPEPTARLTRQGRAMARAASRGAAFCEECERAKESACV